MKYEKQINSIMKNLGSEDNIISLVHCVTRLRFTVKNKDAVNVKNLENVNGVLKVIEVGSQIQVVIGTQVKEVFKEVKELYPNIIKSDEMVAEIDDESEKKKKNIISVLLDTISSIFTPFLGLISGAGILKGLLAVCINAGWLISDSGTYQILNAAADGVFKFLPVILAFTAAEKFKTDKFVAVGVALALVYPNMIEAYANGDALSFVGIPVTLVSYTSTVIPIILTVYVLSKLEKFLEKIVPSMIKIFLIPLLCLAILVPAAFLVIGPVSDLVGNSLASGYQILVGINPIIAGWVLGTVWPFLIILGVHWAFFPIVFMNLEKYGRDTFFTIAGPNNFAQAGAAFGVFMKTKNKGVKQIAGSASVSALIAGITEPALYGINLKYKRPFFIGVFFTGIASAIVAWSGAGTTTYIGTNLLTLPARIGVGFGGFLFACALAFFGTAITTYFFGFNDGMVKTEEFEEIEEIEEVQGSVVESN